MRLKPKHYIIPAIIIIVTVFTLFIALKDMGNPITTAINNTISTCTNTPNGDVCTHSVRR